MKTASAMIEKAAFTNEETPFEEWWRKEGRQMSPYVSETPEQTSRRIAHIAWLQAEDNAAKLERGQP